MIKKTILMITDGIGYSPKEEFNAFYHAKKPTYDYLFKNYPNSMIATHGLSVGLPVGQMGNSEVGHMTIGSGRTLYSDLVKISKSLKDEEFENIPSFQKILERDRIHLIGLLSDGGVHSHIEHLFGIVDLILKNGKKVIVHAITDGRDVSPTSSKNYISQLTDKFGDRVEIASISGRFYSMDRDKRWERVEKGFRAIVEGDGKTDLTPLQYIDQSYAKGENDEFIEPVAFGKYDGFKNYDGVLFYNFRSDRMREIVSAIGGYDFSEFSRKFIRDLAIATMTKYSDDLDFPILFEKDSPKNGLSETISKAGLTQFHTAETEKYAHVTFFLNGGVEEPFLNETRVLIDSPKVKTYDMKPSMSAEKVTDAVLNAIDSDFDLIIVNYANGDMVGHTGVFEAGIEAVETVDREVGRVYRKAREKNYSILLTSDHGNCENMRDENGEVLTNHTVGDVFCFVIDDEVKTLKDGGLNNIAPTILKMMNLEIPKEMDEPLF